MVATFAAADDACRRGVCVLVKIHSDQAVSVGSYPPTP